MTLKQTTEREKSLRELTAAVELDLDEVMEDVEKLIAALAPDESISAAQLGALPKELLAHLQRLLADLIEKENRAVSEELSMRAKGKTLHKGFMDTRKMLMKVRDMLKNVYGDKGADQLLLGVPAQIPRSMVAGLIRMCRYTLRQLRNPEVEVEIHESLKATYPKGRETFVKLLEKPFDNLCKLSKQYTRSQVRVIGFQVQRRAAMEEYNRCFPEIAKIFVCLFRLSGRLDLAENFQPSGQEKGLLRKLVKLRRAIRAGMKEGKKKRQQEASETLAATESPMETSSS